MKQILCVVLVVAAIGYSQAAATGQKNEDRYTNKYNNFDVDAVLNNTKILKSYVRCVLGEGPCTNEGRELAKIVPDAIKTECAKCDEKQKTTSLKVMKHLNRHHPDLLEKLMRKFDPKGEHEKKLREQIRKAEAISAAPPSSSVSPSSSAPVESSTKAEAKPAPVTKLETKVSPKPTTAPAPAKSETKPESKPVATKAESKPEIKQEAITRLEAKPASEKPKPAETKKPASN